MKVKTGISLRDILVPGAIIFGGLAISLSSKDIYTELSGLPMTFLGLGTLAHALYSPRMRIEEATVEELADVKVIKYHEKSSSSDDEYDREREVKRTRRINVIDLEGVVEKINIVAYDFQPADVVITITDGRKSIPCYTQGAVFINKGDKIKVSGFLKRRNNASGNYISVYESERVSEVQAVPA
jgi:hypothetical protein